jgi:HipA-like protein
MVITATHIFAFDALIANDDRRSDNPNLLVRGDDIFVIDHEAAFAFLYLVGRRETAWDLRRRPFRQHVFYYQLRKESTNLRLFMQRLAQLGDAELENMISQLPNEWLHADLGRISAHLQHVRDHAEEFERQVQEALA